MKILVKDPNVIKKELLLKGLSQRKLAELIGYSSPFINQVVNGERSPSGKMAKKIIDELQVEFDSIFFIDDDYKSNQTVIS